MNSLNFVNTKADKMKKIITFLALAFFIHAKAQTCTPSITIIPDDTICSGQTITVTASGATNYTWAPAGANTSSITATPVNTTNMPISVIYTLTASTGTCTTSNTVSVVVLPNPTAGFSYAVCTCIGTNATAFSDTTHAIAGDSIIMWHWTFSGQGYHATSTIKKPGEDPANGSDTACLTVTTKHGCISSTCTVIANYIESINNVKNTLPPSVFPNPAKNYIQLTGMDAYASNVLITDALGNNVVKDQELKRENGVVYIDISNLPAGIYFVQVGISMQKFIKQ